MEFTYSYTKEYFIEKFNSIPDENWLEDGNLNHPTKENCGCALFHCGVKKDAIGSYIATEEALALIELFGGNRNNSIPPYRVVYRVNDTAYEKGLTPKQAIIEKLNSL